jgi:oligopeptidase B
MRAAYPPAQILLPIGLLACSAPGTDEGTARPAAPVARVEPFEITQHGHARVDDYQWLQDPEDPEVLAYLEAENAYTRTMMVHTEGLQEELLQETRRRAPEAGSSPFWREGGYLYYWRWEEGRDYPIYARKRGSLGAGEEILVDVNEIARGHGYTRVPFPTISPDQSLLAFAVDTVGIPAQSTIRLRDLATGDLLPDAIHPGSPLMAWAGDNRTLFYLRRHPTLGRPSLYRHVVGTDPGSDEPVVDNLLPSLTRTTGHLVVESDSALLYLDADRPYGAIRTLLARQPGCEYDVRAGGGWFFVRTNAGGAPNFRLMRAAAGATGTGPWEDIVPHREDVLLEGYQVFRDYLVLQEREGGLVRVRVRPWAADAEYVLDFPDLVHQAAIQAGDFESNTLRYEYSSFITPPSAYDLDLESREGTLVWRERISGGYDPTAYGSERARAPAPDGSLVPVSLLYRKGLRRNGRNPLVLYGYGGATVDAAFDPTLFSLVDRGFVYAIAHVRGGRELGYRWEAGGQGPHTRNRFTDFIAVAEFLIREGYTSPERLFAHGMSSGGLLVGAVANMRPGLFKGMVAQVPWVDVLTGFLSSSMPTEVGDPGEDADYRYVRSYSPYQNVQAQDYPNMLVTAVLDDTQVPFWIPVKWVALLRATRTDRNVLLLNTNLEAGGHAGRSGRLERWKETAFLHAFLLDLAGVRR